MDTPTKRRKLDNDGNFLADHTLHILQAGIGKARTDIFIKQARKYGALVSEKFNKDSVSHLIVDEKMEIDRLLRILKVKPAEIKNITILTSLWLSACIKSKCLEETDKYTLGQSIKSYIENEERKAKIIEAAKVPDETTENDEATTGTAEKNDGVTKYPKVGTMYRFKQKAPGIEMAIDADPDSDYEASGDEKPVEPSPSTSRNLPKGNWVCARSSDATTINHNQHITDKLQALAKTYESTNDRWRALGYQKAIAAVKKCSKPISSFEEAKALPGVGNRLAEKIWEIIESGGLRKLEELSSSEEIQTINMFTDIWGAGPTTARAWLAQGFRTLDDLKKKGNLTRHQQIGLRHYDDFLDRMPREEAAEIEVVVKRAAEALVAGVIAMACGSYRRGKKTCGDVDVLITHPDGKSHKGIFSKLLNNLRETGFLTDDLVQQEDNGNQKKYLGVCKLPGENKRHRRLDIIVVPYDEYACAIMYFTGSAHFNRSMRNLASKMGMSLSEHALCAGVVRSKGEKINKGTPLPTPTEESVFGHFGLKYRPPEERDH